MTKLMVTAVIATVLGLTTGVAGASPVFGARIHCVTDKHGLAVNTRFTPTSDTVVLIARVTWHDAKGRHKVVLARNTLMAAGATLQKRFVIHESVVKGLNVVLVTPGATFETGSPYSGPC